MQTCYITEKRLQSHTLRKQCINNVLNTVIFYQQPQLFNLQIDADIK